MQLAKEKNFEESGFCVRIVSYTFMYSNKRSADMQMIYNGFYIITTSN